MNDDPIVGLIAEAAAALPGSVWVAALAVLALSILTAVTILALRADYTRPRDPQRLFDGAQKSILRARCGSRCEHDPWWGPRCDGGAEHADHIHPWSRGGATSVENGAMLCARHNLAKSDWKPTTYYIWRLQRRRRAYFPAGAELRVWKYYGAPPTWR